MNLNPFKDSNLNDLQKDIHLFIKDHFTNIQTNFQTKWKKFVKKGKERITIMFIPHNEKKIMNFHISIFAISAIVISIASIVSITSIIIVNHSSSIKEVSKLERNEKISEEHKKLYQEELNNLYSTYLNFKPQIASLYYMDKGTNLFAKGGTNDGVSTNNATPVPSEKLLEIQEMEQELQNTKQALEQVKVFLDTRKKIIENTPSIWPVAGYIVAKSNFNQGVEIASFPGAEIKSTAPGTVDNIRWDSVLGLTITVAHKYGYYTTYSHCQRISAEVGQKVSKGEVIAFVGNTGKTTSEVCFYQIRVGTEFVNPIPYLNKISRIQ